MTPTPRPYLPDVRRDLEDAAESPVHQINHGIRRLIEVHIPNLIEMVEAALQVGHGPTCRAVQDVLTKPDAQPGDQEGTGT